MTQRRAMTSTLPRLLVAALLVVGAMVLISRLISPETVDPPVFIDHAPVDGTVVPLSDESQSQRFELNAALSDQEISRRSVEAVAAVAPAVVVIHRATDEGVPDVLGSGVVISSDGLILASLGTTGIDGELQVTWSTGESSAARVIRIDEKYQIVLLQADAGPSAVAPLADYPARSGDRVLAIGSPLEDFTHTVTSGVVGAIGVTLPTVDSEIRIPDLIQHDAATNPGNEGGPIVDLNGNVIGINIGSVVELDGVPIQGWSFAVPVSVLSDLLTLPD